MHSIVIGYIGSARAGQFIFLNLSAFPKVMRSNKAHLYRIDTIMTPNSSKQALAAAGPTSGISKLGFPLLDSSGRHIGQIDRITIAHGRLCVEGWALTGLVGLASGDQKFEREPHLAREDVLMHLGDTGALTPGFSLDIPVSLNHVVFWTEVSGIRYIYPLPRITIDDLQKQGNA